MRAIASLRRSARLGHQLSRRHAAWPLVVLAYIAIVALVAPNARRRLAGGWLSSPRSGTPASVVAVIDGDTVEVAGGVTVRLLGLDAPETKNPNMDGPQPFGPEASARLTQLLAGREVLLERDVVGLDHYGRSLRHVWLGDTLAAEVLIAEGLAYAQSIPPNTLHADRLERAEAAARQAKVGLWGLPRPTPLPLFASPSP